MVSLHDLSHRLGKTCVPIKCIHVIREELLQTGDHTASSNFVLRLDLTHDVLHCDFHDGFGYI